MDGPDAFDWSALLDPGPENPDDDPAATVDSIIYRHAAGLPLTPEQTGWIVEGLRPGRPTNAAGISPSIWGCANRARKPVAGPT